MNGLWEQLLPNLLYFAAQPLAVFWFLCRYCTAQMKWPSGLLYTAAYTLLALAELRFSVSGTLGLFGELLLLAAAGFLLCKDWGRAAAAAALAVSVCAVCQGLAQTVVYWFFTNVQPWRLFRYADTLQGLGQLFLTAVFLAVTAFRQSTDNGSAALLVVPVFFISLVERTIRDSIYGDTVITSSAGIIFPVVRHGEILFLQLTACACLFITLAAHRKIMQAMQARQVIQLLRQQAQVQETYIWEARSRYEQTRAFRHDVQNHLSVLSKLLRSGKQQEAYAYLSKLADAAAELSFPVQTGNAAADALLGSKLAAAQQHGICVLCELRLPPDGAEDIDWCVVLSNAADNAIRACGALPEEKRFIRITGSMQGNFYLLCMENSCAETLAGTPPEGIGLANIRAVSEKYQGTVKAEAAGGVFRLEVLFVISQRGKDVSQQSS